MKIYDAIESGVEHEAVLEMGLADLVYYLKNSDLPPSKILELAKKQPLKKSDERMKPEFSGSRFYQFPIEIIFSHKGNILSVKVAEESF